MINQKHIEINFLQQLLEGDCPANITTRIESHVQDCQRCRQQLEELAADSDIWKKASALLATQDIGVTTSIDFGPSDRRVDQAGDEDDFPLFSVSSLLESPTHPEMLGRLGQYDIEREIGRGGMGVVLKAHDRELHRSVAIKIMAPHLASNGAARQRFAREARAAAAVLHPNVISIHGVNSEGRTPYLVMPIVDGPSLEQIINRNGPLDEKDIVRVGMQIAAGLAAAHAQGVVHRDIKPANVLIESGIGRVLITDFGLARAETEASMTQTGWFAGTPNFMSPEQSRGFDIDHRSDLFSLGSVMYFMATGRLPFRAEQPMAVLDRIRSDHPTAVRIVNPDISTTLANITERLLAKRPEDRFQSSAELHAVLEQYLAHLHRPDSIAGPVVKPAKLRKPGHRSILQRYAAVWSLAAATSIALLAFLLGQMYSSANPPVTASPITSYLSIAQKYDLMPMQELDNEMQLLDRQLHALASDPSNISTADQSEISISDPLSNLIQNLQQQMISIEQAIDFPNRNPK